MKRLVSFVLSITLFLSLGILGYATNEEDQQLRMTIDKMVSLSNNCNDLEMKAENLKYSAMNQYNNSMQYVNTSVYPQITQTYNQTLAYSQAATDAIKSVKDSLINWGKINDGKQSSSTLLPIAKELEQKAQQAFDKAGNNIQQGTASLAQLTNTVNAAVVEFNKPKPPALPPTPAPNLDAAQASLKMECDKLLLEFYNDRFDPNYEYTNVIKLDIVNYRSKLADIKIIIDPNNVFSYNPNTTNLSMDADPRTAKNSTMAQALFHEMTHRIEDINGDIGADMDNETRKKYDERNIDFMLQRLFDVGNKLRRIESGAAKGETKEKIIELIKQMYVTWEGVKSNGNYLPSVSELKKWFGFEFDMNNIEDNYINNSKYPILREAFKEYRDGKAKTTEDTISIPVGLGGTTSGRFPDTGEYAGNVTEYSISGINLTKSELIEGNATGYTRALKGTFGGSAVTVSGTVSASNGYYSLIKIYIRFNGSTAEKYFKEVSFKIGPQGDSKTATFNLSLPIPADATSLDIAIINDWSSKYPRSYNVEGSFNRDAVKTPAKAPGTIGVLLNGIELDFDQPPIIENDRTLVPMRAIFEAMGAKVEWNEDTQTVTATKNNTTIMIQIGSNTAYVNGQKTALAVPARIVNGRTLVPIRFIAESLGANVSWDSANNNVIIGY